MYEEGLKVIIVITIIIINFIATMSNPLRMITWGCLKFCNKIMLATKMAMEHAYLD